MFELNTKFDADLLLYSLSHFEYNRNTIHMLTQQHLPPPLTSTVKSSLFIHVHPSPLSLAARLHQCCTNHSHYFNNGWTFSRQISYSWLPIFGKPWPQANTLLNTFLQSQQTFDLSPCEPISGRSLGKKTLCFWLLSVFHNIPKSVK